MARVRAKRQDFVLDVGSGGRPHSTADILVERFLEDIQNHRSRNSLVRDRPLVCADIQALPFRDKAFDYVICNHVVEHVDDAGQAVRELGRVGARGFLNVPSELWEFICPSPAHQWVCALKDSTLLLKRKQQLHDLGIQMYGGVFHFLQGHADFRRLTLTRPNLFTVAFEWRGSISYRICDDDEAFYDYEDQSSTQHLLQPVGPDGLIDGVKRWLKINLDLDQVYRLTRVLSRVRRLVKGSPPPSSLPTVLHAHTSSAAGESREDASALDRRLLEILVCPADRASVAPVADHLVCSFCQRRYPVRDGIPVMLIAEAAIGGADVASAA